METSIQVEVSAWVAIIQYFKSQAILTAPDVFGLQIAGRHKYGNGWTPGSLGFVLKPDSGMSELYVGDSTQRFECRIYGNTGYDCETSYMKVKQLIKNFTRCVVDNALIQRVWTETTPMLLDDPDLKSPFFMFFISASISEKGV